VKGGILKSIEISQAIYFARGTGQAESRLTLQELNIPFVKEVKYVCEMFGVYYT